MSQLPGEQHNLPAVMAFMRGEIGKKVADVQREVAPHVRRGDRNTAAGLASEPEKGADAQTAAFERRHQLPPADSPAIDAVRHRNAMRLADHFDPHATSVMDMSCNHADGATRSTWNARSPERGGQVLDEKDRDAVVRPPRRKDRVSEVRRGEHCQALDGRLSGEGAARLLQRRVSQRGGTWVAITHVPFSRTPHGGVWSVRPPVDRCE